MSNNEILTLVLEVLAGVVLAAAIGWRRFKNVAGSPVRRYDDRQAKWYDLWPAVVVGLLALSGAPNEALCLSLCDSWNIDPNGSVGVIGASLVSSVSMIALTAAYWWLLITVSRGTCRLRIKNSKRHKKSLGF